MQPDDEVWKNHLWTKRWCASPTTRVDETRARGDFASKMRLTGCMQDEDGARDEACGRPVSLFPMRFGAVGGLISSQHFPTTLVIFCNGWACPVGGNLVPVPHGGRYWTIHAAFSRMDEQATLPWPYENVERHSDADLHSHGGSLADRVRTQATDTMTWMQVFLARYCPLGNLDDRRAAW